MLDPQPQAISSWRHSTQVPELGSSEASALRWPETPAFLLKDDKPDKVLIAFLLAITALKPHIISVIFLTFPFQWTRKKAFLWSQYYSRSEMSLTWQRLDRKSMAREGHPCHPAALVLPPQLQPKGVELIAISSLSLRWVCCLSDRGYEWVPEGCFRNKKITLFTVTLRISNLTQWKCFLCFSTEKEKTGLLNVPQKRTVLYVKNGNNHSVKLLGEGVSIKLRTTTITLG